MSTSSDRPRSGLVVAGAIVLLVLQLGGAALLALATLRPSRPGAIAGTPGGTPDLLGALAWYTDDGFALGGMHGPEIVRIGPETVLRTLTGPASLADLLPGAGIAVWGRDPARVVLVGGVPR